MGGGIVSIKLVGGRRKGHQTHGENTKPSQKNKKKRFLPEGNSESLRRADGNIDAKVSRRLEHTHQNPAEIQGQNTRKKKLQTATKKK